MCHPDPRPHTKPGGEPGRTGSVARGALAALSLPCHVEEPTEGASSTAVLLIHDVFGPGAFYQGLCARIAATGHLVAMPDLFFRLGPIPPNDRSAALARRSRLSQLEALADLAEVTEALRCAEGVNHVVAMGFCMGGTLALLAQVKAKADATLAYYPSLNRPVSEFEPLSVAEVGPHITNPVLIFHGQADTTSACGQVEELCHQLLASGTACELHTYAGQDHAFLTFEGDGSQAAASRTSWQRAMSFLENSQLLPGVYPHADDSAAC